MKLNKTKIKKDKVMKIVKTSTDGWGCVPELMQAVKLIDGLGHDIYEIKNCVRQTDLDLMVQNMKDYLQEAIEVLDSIDTNREFKTI
jgi:hypothetical protein